MSKIAVLNLLSELIQETIFSQKLDFLLIEMIIWSISMELNQIKLCEIAKILKILLIYYCFVKKISFQEDFLQSGTHKLGGGGNKKVSLFEHSTIHFGILKIFISHKFCKKCFSQASEVHFTNVGPRTINTFFFMCLRP